MGISPLRINNWILVIVLKVLQESGLLKLMKIQTERTNLALAQGPLASEDDVFAILVEDPSKGNRNHLLGIRPVPTARDVAEANTERIVNVKVTPTVGFPEMVLEKLILFRSEILETLLKKHAVGLVIELTIRLKPRPVIANIQDTTPAHHFKVKAVHQLRAIRLTFAFGAKLPSPLKHPDAIVPRIPVERIIRPIIFHLNQIFMGKLRRDVQVAIFAENNIDEILIQMLVKMPTPEVAPIRKPAELRIERRPRFAFPRGLLDETIQRRQVITEIPRITVPMLVRPHLDVPTLEKLVARIDEIVLALLIQSNGVILPLEATGVIDPATEPTSADSQVLVILAHEQTLHKTDAIGTSCCELQLNSTS